MSAPSKAHTFLAGRFLQATVGGILFVATGATFGQTTTVDNLVVNGDLDSNISGWEIPLDHEVETEVLWNSDGNQGSGSLRATQLWGGSPVTRFDLARQCIPVQGGEVYELKGAVRSREDNQVPGNPAILVAWPPGGCADERDAWEFFQAQGEGLIFPDEFVDWMSAGTLFRVPASISEVRLAVSVSVYQLPLGQETYGAFFDDIEFGRVRPDLVAGIDFMDQTASAQQQVTFDVSIANNGELVGTARDIEATIDAHNLLTYVSETCPGDMINSTTGNDDIIRWFNIPDLAADQVISCSVTAKVEPGFSGVIDPRLQLNCPDCDLRPEDNYADGTLNIAPRADIAASISAQAYQSIEKTLQISIELENLGTAEWNEQVLINKPSLANLSPGTCNGSSIAVEDATILSFPISIPPGQARRCSIGFDYPDGNQTLSFGVSANSPSSIDYDSSNNSDSVVVNTVSLRVTAPSIDRSDQNPGDGVCLTQLGRLSFCTLRGAIQEANALPGVQVVVLPYASGGYPLSLAGGDKHIPITDTVEIVGERQGSTLPRVFGNWANGDDRSRLFLIDSPTGRVDMSDLHLQGQDWLLAGEGGLIKATDTDLALFNMILEDGGANFAGGALWSNRGINMERVFVHSNRAPFGAGIALIADNSNEQLTIRESRIHDNSNPPLTPQATGGGVLMDGGRLKLLRSSIDNNASSRGAGIALRNNAYAEILNATISTNSAAVQGGGLWASNSDADLSFVTVALNAADRGNASSGEGGGIYATPTSVVSVANSIFSENEAQATGVPVGFPLGSTCFGPLSSVGYNTFAPNLNFDDACLATAAATDNESLPPSLAALAPLGAMDVPYHELTAQRQDIDLADPACAALDGLPIFNDQRNAPRPLDGDGDSTEACDKGAFESDGGFPSLAFSCPSQITVEAESFVTATCSVTSINGMVGDVFFSCAGSPPSCDFVPEPLNLMANATQDVDLIIYGNATASPRSVTVYALVGPANGSADVEVITTGIVAPPAEVTVTTSATGNGNVVSSPAGIDCSITCSAMFAESLGTVSLTATPDPGWEFAHWTGDCAGAGMPLPGGASRCILGTESDKNAGAVFSEITSVEVDVTLVGNGQVQSSPAGIQCPGTCASTFTTLGNDIVLTATPDAGWEFLGWAGGCSGTATCDLDDGADNSVEARFGFQNQSPGLIFSNGFE